MPSIMNAPCAKLTMRITPKISAMPMPISEYSEPVSTPSSTACSAFQNCASIAYYRVPCALRALGPLRRGQDRLGLGLIGRPHDLVLSALDLRDQHRVRVLALGIERDRPERSVEVLGADRVGDLLVVLRPGVL